MKMEQCSEIAYTVYADGTECSETSAYKIKIPGIIHNKVNVGRVMPSITQLEVFLIDVIIRNQNINKLETTCFGLTLAIFRFHLEKLFIRFVILRNGDGKP